MVHCFCIWIPKDKTASLSHCHARNFKRINPQVPAPAIGESANLQVLRETVPGNCHALSVDWNSITVGRHEVSVQRKCVLVSSDPCAACSHPVRGQQEEYFDFWKAIPVQQNGADHIATSVSFDQDGAPVGWNPMAFPYDSGPADRNTNPVEQHNIPKRKNTIHVDTYGIHVGRNPILVVRDSLREQLSSTIKTLFIAKTAKFHQFRHLWFPYHSNHTHRDTPVTVHSIHFFTKEA